MTTTLLGSCFAAARKHLKDARIAQKNALLFGLDVYKAGERGRRARNLRHYWNRKRTAFLEEALQVRRRLHQLRAELRRLELEDTIPPRSSAA